MKIGYTLEGADSNRRGITKAIGNMLMYYADTSLRVEQNLRMLKNNERARDMLVNKLREGTGSTAMTIDSVLGAIENALGTGGIFTFNIDGTPLCDIVKGKKSVEIEVFMHENYFLVEATKNSLIPSFGGFRHKEDKFVNQVKTEKLKWRQWFEHELNKDFHPADKTKSRIIEE